MGSLRTEKLLSPQGWMPQLVFSGRWNPQEADSNANQGMDLLARPEQAGKEQKLSFSF